ncbi:MAG: HdeA/HdeB family chaperone [bacterium]
MRKIVALSAVIVLLFAVSTGAQQVSITPRIVQLDRFTCADLLARQDELRDRTLIYMNGYINGLRAQKVWDEKVEGERIDKAVRECRAAPAKLLLDVLTGLWPR